ncbi:hypothetical protein F0L74_28820 [Chitinophaga agrisoli]|uniref:HTH domain-containing protein n=1 Tax=Chitinophaga agrisoli TaxID=2607653 RepID=A0A5B2VKN3_9BACT|nr:hypothetical protein [Chitinophaga agrisoli]KAA2240173.1 hypothetical protein F0L74_28820 [Chitinophaga agrisoli]
MSREIFHRIQRIDYFIRIKNTGTPAELAEKIGICERSVYLYLNIMKELGAPIKFSNSRQSYYYDEDGSFMMAFHPKCNVTTRL